MAVASITEATKRFNRLLLLTDSYVVPLSNPPKRRSFNSDQEILDILLEADELLMFDVRNSIGHPYAPTFYARSTYLSHGDKIPAVDSSIFRVQWSTVPTALGTLTVAEASVGASAHGTLTISGSALAASGSLTVTSGTVAATGTLTVADSVQAVGTLTVATLPIANDTIVVYGTTFTFVTSVHPTAVQITVQTTARNQATAIAQALTSYAAANPSSNVASATYTTLNTKVNIQAVIPGTAGNSFTTVGNARVTAQQAALTGGLDSVVTDEVVYVNGIQCVFNVGTNTSTVIYVGTPTTDADDNAANLVGALNNSTNASLTIASYSSSANVITISYDTLGAIGNTFTLAESDIGHITVSGATLTGGIGGIVQGETIVINGVTYTFSNFNTGTLFVPFSSDGVASESADLLAEKLNASANGSINVATYTTSAGVMTITYDTPGTGGNAFTLANSSGSGITRSGATLTGGLAGIVEGETIVVNGVTFTFTNLSSGVTKIPFVTSAQTNSQYMAATLNASTNASINVAIYTPFDLGGESVANFGITITYLLHGVAGNSYTLANSSGGAVTRSGATLTGGVDDGGIQAGETIVVNGVTFTFSHSVGATNIDFTSDINTNASNIQAKLAVSSNVLLTVATYTVLNNVVTISGDTTFILANSSASHVTRSGATLLDSYADSEESDKEDIIEAVKAIAAGDATFGTAADTYGYHDIIANELYTTSPYVKVVQAPWTRTTLCQSPMSYTTAIILLAISLAPKDGLDVNLLNYADKKASEFRAMIRQGAMILPTVTEFGLSEKGAP